MENENEQKQTLSFNQEEVEITPKKKLPKPLKIFGIIIISIVSLFVVVWAGLNVFKYAIYAEFYGLKKDVCEIPGLNSNLTQQGCAYDDENDLIYVTGYNDKTGSAIFTVNGGKPSTHYLYKDGEPFKGHVGGIASSGSYVYLADGEHIYTIDKGVLSPTSKDNVEIGDGVKVNNAASFIFSDDTYIYVGEFNNDKQYVTENYFQENKAIVEVFAKEDFNPSSTSATTLKIISIRNKVQGFCVTPSGKYVLSTSYGLASSYFYVYNPDTLVETTTEMYGAKVCFFREVSRTILAPAMMEDLDIYKDGRVLTLTEAASNKYIFGKFFFANHIMSLNIK